MTKLEHWSRRAQPKGLLAKSDEWRTQAKLFGYANKRYGPFLQDVAAAAWNHQCASYLTKEDNALHHRWARRCWCNPPYSRGWKDRFCRYARNQVHSGASDLVCMLLPHDTADGYWRRHVEGPAGRLLRVTKEINDVGTVIQTQWSELTVEKTELYGRCRYEHNDGSSSCRPGTARHSSALVVFAAPGVLTPLVQTSVLKGAA